MLKIPGLERLDRYESDHSVVGKKICSDEDGNGSRRNVEKESRNGFGGNIEEEKSRKRQRGVLQFEWSNSEDTFLLGSNDLYMNRLNLEKMFNERNMKKISRKEVDNEKNNKHELGDDEFLNEKPSLGYFEMAERDWKIFREDYSINVRGKDVPNPIRNWEDCYALQIHKELIRNIGYEKPTPIQMQCIPIGLKLRDMIGIAETGSGKTIAFLIPLICNVGNKPALDYKTSQEGPYGLILAPARELALQIDDEAQKLLSKANELKRIRTLAIVGGRNIDQQAFLLRKGVEIIVATPGRMQDCLEKALTVLVQCSYVILDEADRMIDLGFQDSLNFILDQIPTEIQRTTHMFSATMQKELENIAKRYLNSPINVTIGDIGTGKKSIQQILNFISENKKKSTLINTLNNKELAVPPIMVFLNQKKMVDIVCREIVSHGFKATSLHGGKMQEVRENSLNLFKNGVFDILVSTDVAGRGIDINNINLVINYDFPKSIDTYTHRIGRTGRAGKNGVAISFITPEDSGLFPELKKILLSSNNPIPNELKNY
ncbi:U5 SNRNP 100 kd protein [Cryptosporidium ubiquitum]|uniref:RNA helicase n=1 Tax=Cryptosporidium ubiquitum TaxID=857276 RepID=A0A1J4MMT7_9CRYT|nr:U5 SNRNP 100 kd protein [Cryptosporidium ubiquitum]OII74332.1 U5 SNRNP 100 kd protein [Cryptosporidium ubiquitum]